MVRGAGTAIVRVVLVLATALLAACAGPQDRDALLLRVGDASWTAPAAPYAERFLDYALLADQSYADSLYPQGPGQATPPRPYDLGPDTYCAGRARPGEACRDVEGLTPYAIRRLQGWRRIYASKEASDFACPETRPGCDAPLPGLGVQVWVKRPRAGAICPEAAIVFRGTDGRSAGDWLSNLRWALRLLPLYDQYDQVQDYAPAFVARIEREPCFRRGRTRIVAVGHSLGGGLAQQAAFREGRIRAVTALDPSFVTGESDLDPALVRRNSRGLEIDQIYERGEVLSYPRLVWEEVVRPPGCDPLLRRIRLDTARGGPIAQHSLATLATALLEWSKTRRDAGLPARSPLPGPDPASCRPVT